MDEILDVCFDEGIFNVPLRQSKHNQVKTIPSRNLCKFSNVLKPIYETQKLSKVGLTQLQCRATHAIMEHDPIIKDDDILYAAFTKEKAGDVKFMRMWLHLFVHMH